MAVLTALTALGIWYLTPVSEVVISALLRTVPLQADLDLGRAAWQQDKSSAHSYTARYYDPYWTPRVERIGRQLVQTADSLSSSSPYPASAYNWDFAVLQDTQTVNAFCLPGGTVRVTLGLLQQLEDLTDGELAALLGHEIGHVIHRHAQARMLERNIVTIVLQALVYQDDDEHEESFGEAMGELLLKSADWLGQQSFSRANEYQADATSWDLLVSLRQSNKLQYHPNALTALLRKLWEYHGRQGGNTAWDSTHPGTLDRIQALEEKWQALPRSQRKQWSRQ